MGVGVYIYIYIYICVCVYVYVDVGMCVEERAPGLAPRQHRRHAELVWDFVARNELHFRALPRNFAMLHLFPKSSEVLSILGAAE